MKRLLRRVLALLVTGCPDPLCSHNPPCGAVCPMCHAPLNKSSRAVEVGEVWEWMCGNCAHLVTEIDA